MHCGAKQSEDATFCHSCGNRLTDHQGTKTQSNQQNRQTFYQGESSEQRISGLEPDIDFNEEEQDDPLIRAYVGEKKSDYYIRKWGKGQISWNWAAFFLGLFWLGYRKMYGMILAILGIYLLIDIVDYFFVLDLGQTSGPQIGIAVVLGMLGNQLYKDHVKRQVQKIKQQRGEKAAVVVQANGGPSWGGFWLSVLMVGVYVVLTITLFAISPSGASPDDSEATMESSEVNDDPSEEEIEQDITTVLEDNINALQNKDIDGYLEMIYQDDATDELYQETEDTLNELFDHHDLNYEINNIEFISVAPDEVVVDLTQTTRWIGGSPYDDNESIVAHTLRRQEGEWKFYNSEIKNVEYLAENEETEEEDDEDQIMVEEAEHLYEISCSACHGTDLGGSVGPDLTQIGSKYSKEELEDIIKNGTGSMPPGLADHMTNEELDLLVDWLSEKK